MRTFQIKSFIWFCGLIVLLGAMVVPTHADESPADKIKKEVDAKSKELDEAKKDAEDEKNSEKKAKKKRDIEEQEAYLSGLKEAEDKVRKQAKNRGAAITTIRALISEEEKALKDKKKERSDAYNAPDGKKVEKLDREMELDQKQIDGKRDAITAIS